MSTYDAGITLQMSRAPQRHDRTGQLARRLHLDVSQSLDGARTRPDRTSVIRHAESPTDRRTLTISHALLGPIYFDVRRSTAVPENTTSDAKGARTVGRGPRSRRCPRVPHI